jgi:membrane-associated protease RseP (regulator of RpoE activity)
MAFAGWIGLVVTALNLLPIGQLDGGHMIHALLGARKGHTVSVAALVALFIFALCWQGYMLWAFIVYFVAGTRDAPTINDVTPVGFGRKALGLFTMLLLLLIIPLPQQFYSAFGIHSPFM